MPTDDGKPPVFDLGSLDGAALDEFARHYESEGYCLLSGLEDQVTNLYPPILMRSTGLSRSELQTILDPEATELILPLELRQKLSRVLTPEDVADKLVSHLDPVLARLLGPIVHVSRDFHAQFKCGATGRVGYGGYDSQQSFMEVHGAYQLHQDFTGASLPTTPAALILWTGLNDCDDWPVRIYPRSHRLGLLCRRFVSVDHSNLSQLGAPLEIHARRGSGVIFNSLLLHGTGSGGPGRRVSCDIRFFPSCPYLQSATHKLVESPAAFIKERLARETGETLRAPLLENQAIAGCMGDNVNVAKHSILNWANYLNDVCNSDQDRAVSHLERFANSEIGLDSPDTYIEQFHRRPMQPATVERIRELIGARKPAVAGYELVEQTAPPFLRKPIPDLSLAMPCYNEADCLNQTVPPLVATFHKAGIDLELVMVDNGSVDQTSAVIDSLISRGFPIEKAVVPVNRGQGLGVRTGLEACRGRHIGYLAADGQVAPESVLLIYRAVATAGDRTIAKVRRRFRPDSLTRQIISTLYNVGMLVIFPGMPSMDVNGSPRIMPREILPMMELTSSDWFLEAEIMLKVQYLRLMVIEIDVPGHLRKGGRSNVGWRTIFEFIRNILSYRTGGPWREWRRKVSETASREVHVEA